MPPHEYVCCHHPHTNQWHAVTITEQQAEPHKNTQLLDFLLSFILLCILIVSFLLLHLNISMCISTSPVYRSSKQLESADKSFCRTAVQQNQSLKASSPSALDAFRPITSPVSSHTACHEEINQVFGNQLVCAKLQISLDSTKEIGTRHVWWQISFIGESCNEKYNEEDPGLWRIPHQTRSRGTGPLRPQTSWQRRRCCSAVNRSFSSHNGTFSHFRVVCNYKWWTWCFSLLRACKHHQVTSELLRFNLHFSCMLYEHRFRCCL